MIEIIEFTDPVCTWCWGSEPILRKLETRYSNDVKIGFVMGGLVKDMNDFQDEFNGIGGENDLSTVNEQIASHWIKASERHKMPVETKGFSLFTKDHTSTYPSNIAYKAAQFQGEEIAHHFLRRIREAAATEAKQVNRLDVLKELASSVGLDEQQWLIDMENGRAEKEFEKDLALCQQFQIYAFPSYLVKDETGKGILLRGFQSYETFQQAIHQLSDGKIKETSRNSQQSLEERVKELILKYESITLFELTYILKCSEQELSPALERLISENMINQTAVGNGYFLTISNR